MSIWSSRATMQTAVLAATRVGRGAVGASLCREPSQYRHIASGSPPRPASHIASVAHVPIIEIGSRNPLTEETSPMAIIDSQVHAYEANTPKRPWHSVPNWPAHVTGDEMVAAMGKVGVDGAIFISAFSMYRYDNSYAKEVQRAHPGRFGIVTPVDPDNPAVADVIADWKKTPGAVGIR